MVCGALVQPVVLAALQVVPSTAETVLPAKLPKLATYTVSVTASTPRAAAPNPTVTEWGTCVHPELSFASQVAPLKTDTVFGPLAGAVVT